MKYMADDGTVFSTEAECLAYENTPMKQLESLIKDEIDWSYSDDAGIQIIEESAVLNFIVSRIDEINKILKPKPKYCEWISNIGNNCYHHPDSISYNTEIEVKRRDGSTDTGLAFDWESDWMETDGHSTDIVAYRILPCLKA